MYTYSMPLLWKYDDDKVYLSEPKVIIHHYVFALINSSLTEEHSDCVGKEEKENDSDVVTPWEVTSSSAGGVDYEKLIGKQQWDEISR